VTSRRPVNGRRAPSGNGRAELPINPDKVRHIIAEARMFDVKEEVTDPDSGSNPADDGMRDILEDRAEDATYQELSEFIRSLDEDEQISLVALAWIGRGTYDIGEWQEVLSEARAAHNPRTAEYLTGLPLLGDDLEEGLAAFEAQAAASTEPAMRLAKHKRAKR
jgi:hypothetical protein